MCVRPGWLLLLALCALVSGAGAPRAHAQTSPPHRFWGLVLSDGQPLPAGAQVTALIGNVTCGAATVGDGGRYLLDVAADASRAGCGVDGVSPIQFVVRGRPAQQTAVFSLGRGTPLDLTVTPLRPYGFARLDLTSPCVPDGSEPRCDTARLALWNGDRIAWAAVQAGRGRPTPSAEEVAALALEYRLAAGDPASTAALARQAGQAHVRISAVRFQATDASGEFIEITNLGAGDQDLTGWSLRLRDRALEIGFPDGYVLVAGASPRFFFPDADSLPDSGGVVQLWVDATGLLVDQVRYAADPNEQPAPPNLQGVE